MTPELLSRREFRERGLELNDGQCIVPWCGGDTEDVHHIIERSLWEDEGYYMRNAANVCNGHHQMAEDNEIPPQAFWHWRDVEPLTPEGLPQDINKWGEEFTPPPWEEHRRHIKYPSTGHLPFSPEWDGTRVDFTDLDMFVDLPCVVTYKMDGSNAMLVKDHDEPVRARNGSHAEHQSFDMLKQLYYEHNVYEKLPENIQIFGEWLYSRHSIHYKNGTSCAGTDLPCDCTDEDCGPPLTEVVNDVYLEEYGDESAYFQIFGVFDTDLNLWLGWPEVEQWALDLGFPAAPCFGTNIPVVFDREDQIYSEETGGLSWGKTAVREGHEGIILRSYYPYHYDQFEHRVAKYVREGHVQPDAEHWKHTQTVRNEL